GDGSVDTTFDAGLKHGGSVYSIALQPDGRLVLGGSFNAIQDVVRYGIARLNGGDNRPPEPPLKTPRIVRQPEPLTVTAGSRAIFEVRAEGTEPISYQWLIQGTPILNATNALLSIDNVQASDSGLYVAVLESASCPIYSAPTELHVVSPLVPPV